MSEKFYVVSESELRKLVSTASDYVFAAGAGFNESTIENTRLELIKVKDACRARPVPEWATEFTGDPYNRGYVESWEFEEIRR
jgi:hypothetical protein